MLSQDLLEHRLNRGDIGAVAPSYTGGQVLEIEFVTGEGQTITVETLDAKDVRPNACQ